MKNMFSLAFRVFNYCLISIVILLLWSPSALASSSLSGLASLRRLAHDSVAFDLALSQERPSLIEFYANWCSACQSMAPKLEQLHQEYGQQINFVMLNIDEPQWQAAIEKYRVIAIPHLVLLSQNHQSVETFIGVVPKVALEKSLTNLIE